MSLIQIRQVRSGGKMFTRALQSNCVNLFAFVIVYVEEITNCENLIKYSTEF